MSYFLISTHSLLFFYDVSTCTRIEQQERLAVVLSTTKISAEAERSKISDGIIFKPFGFIQSSQYDKFPNFCKFLVPLLDVLSTLAILPPKPHSGRPKLISPPDQQRLIQTATSSRYHHHILLLKWLESMLSKRYSGKDISKNEIASGTGSQQISPNEIFNVRHQGYAGRNRSASPRWCCRLLLVKVSPRLDLLFTYWMLIGETHLICKNEHQTRSDQYQK